MTLGIEVFQEVMNEREIMIILPVTAGVEVAQKDSDSANSLLFENQSNKYNKRLYSYEEQDSVALSEGVQYLNRMIKREKLKKANSEITMEKERSLVKVIQAQNQEKIRKSVVSTSKNTEAGPSTSFKILEDMPQESNSNIKDRFYLKTLDFFLNEGHNTPYNNNYTNSGTDTNINIGTGTDTNTNTKSRDIKNDKDQKNMKITTDPGRDFSILKVNLIENPLNLIKGLSQIEVTLNPVIDILNLVVDILNPVIDILNL
ncbi:3720_t:CDS:2, partial [Funneliformis geosporum]